MHSFVVCRFHNELHLDIHTNTHCIIIYSAARTVFGTVLSLKTKMKRFLPSRSVDSHAVTNSGRKTATPPRFSFNGEMTQMSPSDLKDRYRKFRCCGVGAFGKVFRAFDRHKAITVAIKQLKICTQVLGNQISKQRIKALKTEISILYKCAKDCDYVTRLYSTYHSESAGSESFWIVMEFCDFGSLKDLIEMLERDNSLLPEPQIAMIASSVLKGLSCLHLHRIIHRDIKPGNILLTSDGWCKLADFGVSADLGMQKNDLRSTFTGA